MDKNASLIEEPTYEELLDRNRELENKVKELDTRLSIIDRSNRNVFDQINDCIFIVILDDGQILDSNRRTCDLLGYQAEDLLSMTLSDLDENYSKTDLKEVGRNLVKEKKLIFETTLKGKDGTSFPFEVSSTLIDYYGKKAVFNIARDISERKRSEKALKENEKRYRTLFNLGQDAVLVLPFVREGQLPVYADINEIACERYGYSREEFLNLAPMDLIPEDKYKEISEIQKRLFLDPNVVFESVHRTKDGKRIPVEINANVFEYEGKKFIFSIARDITRRKKGEQMRHSLEIRLAQAQKMEAIGTLAGGIAHDFNNLLSGIMGFTELALLDLEPGSKAKTSLQSVQKAGERAKQLVNQILTFSRQGEKDPRPVKWSMIVKEVMKLLRASLPSTIEIKQDIKSESLVNSDPTELHQVVMNLCTNAGHAMQEKGGILEVFLNEVEIGPVSLTANADLETGSYIELIVKDNGKGIPPDMINRIFDPYFTTKEKGAGTGLGLSMVQGIVKAYGGVVTVESRPGKGSAFRVLLPVIEKDYVPEKEAKEKMKTGVERILFIDDEAFLVEIGQEMISRLGYRVEKRTSSLEALKLFSNQPDDFDLVITDMTMPNMTGKELAKELIAIRKDIPIILCTGFSNQIDEKTAKEIGIKAYLKKPMVMSHLADTIRKVLDE